MINPAKPEIKAARPRTYTTLWDTIDRHRELIEDIVQKFDKPPASDAVCCGAQTPIDGRSQCCPLVFVQARAPQEGFTVDQAVGSVIIKP